MAIATGAATVGSGTSVVLDGTLSSDPDGDPLTYSWTLSGAPSGSAASLTNATTAQPTLTPDQAGTYTLTLVVSDGRAISPASTLNIVSQASSLPSIQLDQTEPLQGPVGLSLAGTVTGAVTWYLDLQWLGTGSAASQGALLWNTTGSTNGAHLLLARIQTGPNTYQELRRSVQVANSPIALSANVSGVTGTINVDVRASSPNGMSSVNARLDTNTPLGSLAGPNACSQWCSGGNDLWRFGINAASAGSGPHSVLVTATDAAGNVRTLTVPVTVSNAPVVTVISPAEGAIVYGSLQVSGSVASDRPGALQTEVLLGSVSFPVSSVAGGGFSSIIDLTGIAAGTYTLNVRATDSAGVVTTLTRAVVVASSPALLQTPVFLLPAGGQLLAAESNRILYRSGDSSVLARNLDTGVDTPLSGSASVQYAADWQLSNGVAYAYGKDGSDCVLYCVYQWNASGVRSNLTASNPNSRTANVGGGWAYDLHPVARKGQVLWINDKATAAGYFTLYNSSAQTYTRITPPPAVNYLGNWNYDLAVVGGVVHVLYWGQTGGSGTSSSFDVFRWQSDTGIQTRLTSEGMRNVYIQTDESRISWQRAPTGGNVDGSFSVQAAPLASTGGGIQTLASSVIQSSLRDGVLAWIESTPTARSLKVSLDNGAGANGSSLTLGTHSSVNLLANGEGLVVYSQAGKLWAWNRTTLQSQLLLELAPSAAFVAAGRVLAVYGNAVYRLSP